MLRLQTRRALVAPVVLAAAVSIASTASADTFAGTVRSDTGDPLGGAHITVNRAARTTSAADGSFTVEAARDPTGDRVIAAAVGFIITAHDLAPGDPTTALELTATSITPDPATYRPSAPSACLECHGAFGRGWGGTGGFLSSAMAESATNPTVIDIFDGTASGWTDEAGCRSVGGSWEEVQSAAGTREHHCYAGAGYLADLNPQCGHDGQPRCDDFGAPAEARPTAFGDCAGCHVPGAAMALPAVLDLNVAALDPLRSGVSCAACHRIREVLDPNLPGVLVGAEISRVPDGSRYFAYGPLDDVTAATMRPSWNPLFEQSRLCGTCHQDTHHAEGEASRWPDGVPSEQTYEEWAESPYASGPRMRTCQSCHMPTLADLGISYPTEGIAAGGAMREAGQIHTHAFDPLTSPGTLASSLPVTLEASREGTEISVTASITNAGVGHAFPSGVTSRNALLVITAAIDRRWLVEVGGEVLPDYAGSVVAGTLEGAAAGTVTLDRDLPRDVTGLELRAWRETSEYRDHVSTGRLRALSVEEKGLLRTEAIGRWRITEARGRDLVLDETDLAVPDLTGARFAIGDDRLLAGTAGMGFAKVSVAADGTRNVPFWRATDILWDNRLAPDETQTSTHRFALPAGATGEVVLGATLLYRKAFVGLADERGWMLEDAESIKVTTRIDLGGSPPGDAGPGDAGAGDAAPSGDGGSPRADAAGSGDAGRPSAGDDGGCDCRATPRGGLPGARAWLVALGCAALLVRRVRRRRAART